MAGRKITRTRDREDRENPDASRWSSGSATYWTSIPDSVFYKDKRKIEDPESKKRISDFMKYQKHAKFRK